MLNKPSYQRQVEKIEKIFIKYLNTSKANKMQVGGGEKNQVRMKGRPSRWHFGPVFPLCFEELGE